MTMLQRIFPWVGQTDGAPKATPRPTTDVDTSLPNEPRWFTSERGLRTTPENQLKYLYQQMWVDPTVRQAILDLREMDRCDGRVKMIHSRVARDVIKGGLVLQLAEDSEVLSREWDTFQRRMQFNRREKLKSDARGFVMEGNLPLQMVLDTTYNLVGAVRMPSETILPNVNEAGRFKDVSQAYFQFDLTIGAIREAFPLWQLLMIRFDADNFDDMGSMGRPFLDASRETWRKLRMTDEDLVIRRRTRAPLRLSHVLKGATKEEVDAYRADVENDQKSIKTDFFSNKEGSVTAVQGDQNLDQINDIVYLLDTFFAGSPLPKGLAGYTDGLARDILEDLKRDYYDEIDELQDEIAFGYEQAFRLQLLLKGINPDAEEAQVSFAERRTETPNQAADRALKYKALGLPEGMVFESMGFDASYVRQRRKYETDNYDPYPDPAGIGLPGNRVSITPGNAPKGESATSISNE